MEREGGERGRRGRLTASEGGYVHEVKEWCFLSDNTEAVWPGW